MENIIGIDDDGNSIDGYFETINQPHHGQIWLKNAAQLSEATFSQRNHTPFPAPALRHCTQIIHPFFRRIRHFQHLALLLPEDRIEQQLTDKRPAFPIDVEHLFHARQKRAVVINPLQRNFANLFQISFSLLGTPTTTERELTCP